MTSDQDDSLIRAYVKAATEYCENQVSGSRSFQTQSWDWFLYRFPGDSFEFPRPPLQSVAHVKYYESAASTGLTTLSSTAYLIHTPSSLPGVIEVHPDKAAWPTVVDGRADAIQIRFTAGYTETPEQIKHAIKLLIGHYYEQRTTVLTGSISKEVEHGTRALLGSVGYGFYR